MRLAPKKKQKPYTRAQVKREFKETMGIYKPRRKRSGKEGVYNPYRKPKECPVELGDKVLHTPTGEVYVVYKIENNLKRVCLLPDIKPPNLDDSRYVNYEGLRGCQSNWEILNDS